jgi:choline-sulfatase
MARRRARLPASSPKLPPAQAGRWALLGRAGVGFAIAVAAGWLAWTRLPSRTTPAGRPSVLLVTIDTLRADGVSSYGQPAASTPVLDALAARGVRFATAVAPVPLTAPSHASILTGLTPVRHGVRDNGGYVLPDETPILSEAFRAAGYETAAFVSGFPLVRRFGFARGFGVFEDHLPHGNDPRRPPYVERTADRTTDAVLRWLDERKAVAVRSAATLAPFFAWLHYYDPHAPYEPPEPFATRFGSRLYYGEAAFVDSQLGRILSKLDEQGLTSETLVLVTADHGESLGEHGEESHGIFVYDSTLRIPWIMAGPGVPRGRVPTTVARAVDIAPTLLDYASLLKPETAMDGRSLRQAASGRRMPDAPTYAESLSSLLHLGWAPLHAWRTERFKLIDAPTPELYDLSADPQESRNIAAVEPARVAELRGALLAAMGVPTPAASKAVDAEAAERLAALGYLASGAPPEPAAGAARKDPKDHVGLILRLERGMSRTRLDPTGSVEDLSAVLDEDPGATMARRYRAVALSALGRHRDAVQDLRTLEKAGGLTAEDMVVLGDCLRLAGRSEEALQALDRAAKLQPKSPRPWLSRGGAFVKAGRNDDAIAAFEEVLKLVPDHIEALRGLGDVAMLQGDVAKAAERYGRILTVDPADVGATVKLGVIRAREGRRDEAARLFRKAVERDPRNGEALLYLAGALAATGRPGEAVPFFERALHVGPRTPMILNGLALAYVELGDAGRASAALRESLALDPRQPDVGRMLTELRARSGAERMPPAPGPMGR